MKKFTILSTFIFLTTIAFAQTDIVITEIMYNSPESDTDSLEFIELYNKGQGTIDISGYYFTSGIIDTLSNGTSIAAGAYYILCVDSEALYKTFGISAHQWNSGALNNSGEAITIRDANGSIVDSVSFTDKSPWPTEADGDGSSLTLCDPTLDNVDNTNWTASTTTTWITVNGIEVLATIGTGCTGSSSVKNLTHDSQNLTFYPNPVIDHTIYFNVAVDGAIYSIDGKKIISFVNQETIDIKNFETGFYILKPNNGESHKFLITCK